MERAWKKEKAETRELAPAAPDGPATPADPPFAAGTAATRTDASTPPTLPSLQLTMPSALAAERVTVPELGRLKRRIMVSPLPLPEREALLKSAARFAGQTIALPALLERLSEGGRHDALSFSAWRLDGTLTLCSRLGLICDDAALPARVFTLRHQHELQETTVPQGEWLTWHLTDPATVDGAAERIARDVAPRGSALIPALVAALRDHPRSRNGLAQALAAYGPLCVEPLQPLISDSGMSSACIQELAMELGVLARPWVPLLLERMRTSESLNEQSDLMLALASTFPDLTDISAAQLNALTDFVSKPYDYQLVDTEPVEAAISLLASAGEQGARALGLAYPPRAPAALRGDDPADHRAWHILERLGHLGPEAFPAFPWLLGKSLIGTAFYRDLGPLTLEQCKLLHDRMLKVGLQAQGLQMLQRGGHEAARMALPSLEWALRPEVVEDDAVQEVAGACIRLLGRLGPVDGGR